MKRPICSLPTRVKKRRLQSETRGAYGNIGGATANRLGEAGDIFQPRADLLAIEIDRGSADRDEVKRLVRVRPFGLAHCFLPAGA